MKENIEIFANGFQSSILILGESNVIPDNKIDELIQKVVEKKLRFYNFKIIRYDGKNYKIYNFYDYMANHPMIGTFIKMDICLLSVNGINQQLLKCLENIILEESGSSRDEFEEYLAVVRSRKSAKNV